MHRFHRFQYRLRSSHNQFGFKTGSGCSHTIYTLHNAVNRVTEGGCTTNIAYVPSTFQKLLIEKITMDYLSS